MSKYDQMLKKNQTEGDGKIWNRYGLTESQWGQLTTEERELQYQRADVCEHPYKFDGPEWSSDTRPYSLRTAYSFDPYFHTAHMDKCLRPAECFCQMCANKIGIPRDMDKPRVDAERVRQKLKQRFQNQEAG